MVARFVALVTFVLLTGCSAMKIEDFKGKSPTLTLEKFFEGDLEGWGVTQGRFGALQQQIRIDAQGRWDEDRQTLFLTETYTFDDGHSDRLEWSIKRMDADRYVGTEPRVEGEAEGRQAGNAFHWTYSRSTPGPDGDTTLTFDDWFWLQPGDVLISRATISRFGVDVASMSIFYRRK